jgi:tetratricopeptide (TPR) repeat protein
VCDVLAERWDDALIAAGRWVELEPKDWRGWCHRGHVRTAKKQYREALADLDQSVTLSPDAVTARAERARAFALLGRWDRCAAEWDEVIRRADKIAEAYLARAEARTALHRLADAVADYGRVLELVATSQDEGHAARHGRGQLLRRVGRYDAALEDFAAMIQESERPVGADLERQAEERNEWAAYEKAVTLYARGDRDEAETQLRAQRSAVHIGAAVEAALALIRLDRGDEAGFRDVCSALLRQEWRDEHTAEQLLPLVWTAGLLPDGVADWKAVLSLVKAWGDEPEDRDQRTTLAALLLRAGDRDRAEALLKVAMEHSPDGRGTLLDRALLAVLDARNGDRDSAAKRLAEIEQDAERRKTLDWPERVVLERLTREADAWLRK